MRLSRYCGESAGTSASASSDDAGGAADAGARGRCVTDGAGYTRFAVPLLELGPWSWSRISLKARSARS